MPRYLLLLAIVLSCLVSRGAADVVITEFLANNNTGIVDEDGDNSDWIELYNDGTAPVNLAGWRLTDDAGDLAKWTFPAVTIEPKGFVVVYASNKDRAVATAPLHTNFKLGAEGGYLALVRPGGTLSTEFDPYPAQYDDKPYGVKQTVSTSTLVAPNATLKYFVPSSAAPSNATWTARTYNDGPWASGTNGAGFVSTVPGFRFSTYFSSSDIGDINQAEAVIAAPSSSSTVTHPVFNFNDSDSAGNYGNENPPPALAGGGNDRFVAEAIGIITVPTAGIWSFCVSSDDGCSMKIRTVGSSTPWTSISNVLVFAGPRGMGNTVGTFSFPTAGEYEVRVVMFENGGGAGGEFSARQGSTGSWDGSFALVGAPGGLAVKSLPVTSGGPGYSGHISTNLQSLMLGGSPQKSSAYLRYSFTNPGGLTSLTMPIRYDDGFVAYLNGTEVGRRNAPAGTPVNTSVATADRNSIQGVLPEHLDLTPHIGSLVAGSGNVLAIHGLNESAASGDFLVKAELAQYSVTPGPVDFFTTPTPGAFNTAPVFLKVAPVVASVKHGFFTSAQSVTLTCGTPGATIRYTFDGSTPTESAGASATYSAPINVTGTRVLRYKAFRPGYEASDSGTQTYIFLSDVITQSPTGAPPVIANPPGASSGSTTWPSSPVNSQVLDYGMDPDIVNSGTYGGTIIEDLKSIPSLSIVTDLPNLFDPATGIYSNPSFDSITAERPASIELISPDGSEAGFQVNCGLRLRGGFSRSPDNPKHAFRIFFRDTYGPGNLNYPLHGAGIGTEDFDRFDLRCAQNYSWAFQGDGSGNFIQDSLARDMQLAMGHPSSHGRFFHLYLNGQYWGLYNVDERPEANFAASYLGGEPDDYDALKTVDGYVIGATDGNFDAWNSLWTLADSQLASGNSEAINNATYQRMLGRNPDGSVNAAFPVLFDPVNTADSMLIIYWGGNTDAQISAFLGNNSPNNTYFLRDRTGAHGGFRSIMHDSEHTLRNVNENRLGPWPSGSTAAQGAQAFSKSTPQYVFQQAMHAQEFKILVADRTFKHTNYDGVLTPTSALALFDARKAEIDRAVVPESARWGDAKTATPLTRDTNWISAINSVRSSFIPARTNILLNQMRSLGWYPNIDPPTWSQRGGTVAAGTTISLALVAGQTGTIYYTTDGSDPRLLGGGVNPAASSYSTPIAIQASQLIRVRTRNGTTWSAIDEATFYVTQDYTGLAITEINYNPPGSGGIDGDEFEFLEFKNTTANPIDAGGLTFTAGITYTFPTGTVVAPGAFHVIVRNTAQFAIRYPGIATHGVYTGKLDGAGENLTLSTATGAGLFTLTYADSAPWPATPDGHGFTAVPRVPGENLNSSDGTKWRGSSAVGGSPGADDPEPNIAGILVTEAVSNTTGGVRDAIEIHNPTGAPVNVGDWWLSDSSNEPKKYRIPANTIIPAGGHLGFDETQFNATPGIGTSFALSAVDDDVYVCSGDAAGNLTGYSHGFSFDGGETNISFGRYVNSVGEEQFPRQTSRTFGAANSGPLVGPLVINEIMYHPYPGFDEYIEIRNLSAAAVNLFDPANPANTWLVDGVNYAFPTGQSIPAGGYALVVPIDPAVFRTKYSVPAAVQIFGPYSGTLQDGGERVGLEQPGVPAMQDNVTVVPYITIDSVRYSDDSPWPQEADGGGASLQRTNSSAYADDPINWFANGATPGGTNFVNQAPSVALTGPASGTTYTVPSTVPFTATASDSDGTVLRVEFYVDGNKVGEDDTSPYAFNWPAAGGVHTCTAVAIDSALGVATSASRTIYVTTPVSKGLKGQYFVNAENFTNGPAGFRIDPTVNFALAGGWPANTGFPGISNEYYSVRWTGQVRPVVSGTYIFYISSDDGSFLYLNDQLVINNGGYHGDQELSYTVSLVAGQLYKIQMDMFQGGGGANARLSWAGPGISKQIVPQSVLYPDSAPIIITHPAGLTREYGTSATLSVLASGYDNTYQWQKGGEDIPGATSASLQIPFVQQADAGSYSVLISNPFGFAASNAATLNVTFADADSDGMHDPWENANGFSTASGADANLDADGDGLTNREEFLAGTDPRAPGSTLAATVTKTGAQWRVSFPAQAHRTYTVQWKASVADTVWMKLQDVPAETTPRLVEVTDSTANGQIQRFYRIVTPKQ